MASAQTAVSSGSTPTPGHQGTGSSKSMASGDRNLYEDVRGSPRSRGSHADAGPGQSNVSIKRRLEERDEAVRYASSPLHRSPQARAASARVPPHEDVRNSPGSRLMRNGGHPSYSSPYEEDGKRRRMDDRYQPALPPPPPGAAAAAAGSMGEYDYAIEEHDEGRYIRAARTSNGRYSPSEGPAPPLPHPSSSEQRRTSLMEGEYDTGVPLARRRGDAAQAKASRLHIDTGSTAVGDAPPSRQSSSYQPSPGRTATVAKSAPPQKMSFSDRGGDAPPFDPRGEPPPPPRYHRSPAQSSYARQGGGPPHSHYVDERAGYESPPLRGPAPSGAHVQSHPSPLPHQQAQHPSHLPQQAPHVQGSMISLPHSARPQAHQGALPSARAFAPQTATLPSPAYHTTHFMRSGGHPGAPPNHSSSTAPRTAGLNPPPTARLPDHLRSPPSSKTQFLSLFANFYDSLSDSRTLKATLEDQVRRSNTLLQTLQRSSRVLELSVDRRLKEERDVWEARVHDLEARCRELERRLGVARPDEDETESRRIRNGTDAKRESGKKDVDEEEERGSKTGPSGPGSDRELSRGRSISQEEEDEVLSEKELQEAPKRGRGRADPRRGADRLSRRNDDDDDDEDAHDADLRRERTRMRVRGDKDEGEQIRNRKSQTRTGSPEEEDEVVDDAMQD